MLPKEKRVFCRTTVSVPDIGSKCGVAVISKTIRSLFLRSEASPEDDEEDDEEDDDDDDDGGDSFWGAIIGGW